MSVSFGLNVSKKRKKLSEFEKEKEDVGDEVSAMLSSGKVVHVDESKNKPAAPLVIPLSTGIVSNSNDDATVAVAITGKDNSSTSPSTAASLDKQLEDAALRELKGGENSSVAAAHSANEDAPSIPLLMQQKNAMLNASGLLSKGKGGAGPPPLSDDQRYKEDVTLRPDNPSLDSYSRVPVEMIGEAMLRGMGWKPGAPVGLTNQQVVVPTDLIKRPGRLGLGAKMEDAIMPTHDKSKRRGGPGDRPLKPGEKVASGLMGLASADGSLRARRAIDEKLMDLSRVGILENQAPVYVTGGRHESLFGRAAETPARSASKCSVRLARSGETVSVKRKHLRVVSEQELKNERLASADNKSSGRKRAISETLDSGRTVSTTADNEANFEEPSPKKSKKKDKKSKKKASSSSSTKSSSAAAGDDSVSRSPSSSSLLATRWVRPDLKVRVVSKSFRDGKYYEKKVRIVDVIAGTECTVEVSDGRVIDGVSQSMLETVIPSVGARCCVVKPRHARVGQMARLLEKNNKKAKCVLQFEDDLAVEKFHYDAVCAAI